ncbi:MAG: hypothetical protein MZV63_15155 [Marinilabiliales bacterium]|nr:hypothetical protein [Marinilabiliales bacterium]
MQARHAGGRAVRGAALCAAAGNCLSPGPAALTQARRRSSPCCENGEASGAKSREPKRSRASTSGCAGIEPVTLNTNQDQTMSTGMPGLDRVLHGPAARRQRGVGSGRHRGLPARAGAAVQRGRPAAAASWSISGSPATRRCWTRACGAEIHVLDPEEGFERFLTEILDVIERAGPGAYYVFDCLSDLAADWFSDRMLGNFFMITCPYLYELDTIAYFALQKNLHSFHATAVHLQHRPGHHRSVSQARTASSSTRMKVWQRYSPTMYMLHSWEGDDFKPVTSSATITDILASVPKPWLEFTIHRPGVWVRTFQEAQQTRARPAGRPAGRRRGRGASFQRLLKMVVTRDERVARRWPRSTSTWPTWSRSCSAWSARA